MKIEPQIMKDINQIKGIIKRLPVLNHIFNRDISFIKDWLKKNIYPPSFKHLIFLSNFIKINDLKPTIGPTPTPNRRARANQDNSPVLICQA